MNAFPAPRPIPCLSIAAALASLVLLCPLGAGAQTASTPSVPAPAVHLDDMVAPPGVALNVHLGAEAPRAGGDRIRIAQPGAGPGDTGGGEALVPAEGPVEITSPLVLGEWELRYVAQEAAGPVVLGASALMVMAEEWKREQRGLAPRP